VLKVREVMLRAHEIAKGIQIGTYKMKIAQGLQQAWAEWRREKMLESLKNMNVEELESLIQKANEILVEKKRENAGEFEFEFSATNDPRKGKPYVARLYWGGEKVERDFFNLHRQWGKKELTVSGKYTARAGDIIEKRVGGSWKNDYRSWYFITETGEEVKVAGIDNSAAKAIVTQYLRHEITAKELLEKVS
jgi:hypothetical protein